MSESSELKRDGKSQPFKRAAAMYMEVLALRSKLQNNLPELQLAMNSFPGYQSRGHGWKPKLWQRTILGNWNQDRSKYRPHQGKSECARRVFQALPTEHRALIRRVEAKLGVIE